MPGTDHNAVKIEIAWNYAETQYAVFNTLLAAENAKTDLPPIFLNEPLIES